MALRVPDLCGAPLDHFLLLGVPLIYASVPYIIAVVVFRAALDDRFSERDIDPALLCLCAFSLRDTVQPIRLRRPPHQDHVSAVERDLERLVGDVLLCIV